MEVRCNIRPATFKKQHMATYKTKSAFAATFYMLLFFVLIAAGCTDSTAVNQQKQTLLPETAPKELRLLEADATLHRRLQGVHEADDRYEALLAAGSVSVEALDETNGQIIQAEMALQQTIDSLKQLYSGTTGNDRDSFMHLTDYFRTTLENRRFLSDMRMIASAETDDSTTMQQTLLRLRADVAAKAKKIAQLEQAAAARTRQATLDLPPTATPLERKLLAPEAASPAQKKDAYAPANGESIEQLKQRNKNLAAALNAIQTQYGTLSKYYRQLKQDYDQVQNELAGMRKSTTQ
jgi:chromosome segregation ATPase